MDITLFFERPEVIRFGCMNGSKCGDWVTFGVLKWLNNPKLFGISFFSTSNCCLLHLLCYNALSGLSCSATHFTNGWEQIQFPFICVLWRLNNIILYYFKWSHSTDVFLLLLVITTSRSQSDSLLVSYGLRSSRKYTVTHECPAAYNYFWNFCLIHILFLFFTGLVFCFSWPGCSCGSCHSPGSNTVIK